MGYLCKIRGRRVSQILSYVAACFNLTGVYLVGNKKRCCFLFFLAAGLLWSVVAVKIGFYALLLEAVPLAILNIIAYRKWGQ